METHTIEEILESVGIKGLNRDSCIKCSQDYIQSTDGLSSGSALLALKDIWERQGKSIKDQRGQIAQIFHHSKGKADIMFIPEIPTFGSIGFVVKLREIFSVDEGRVFRDSLMISNMRDEENFVRIGRFVDGLKYAIVQRMALLFSRIGLDEHFESEISTGYEIVSEHIFRDTGGVQ